MLLVPSHDCLLLKETFSTTCLLAVRVISQTDPGLTSVNLLTQRLLIFTCLTIHCLRDAIDKAIHTLAQPGGI